MQLMINVQIFRKYNESTRQSNHNTACLASIHRDRCVKRWFSALIIVHLQNLVAAWQQTGTQYHSHVSFYIIFIVMDILHGILNGICHYFLALNATSLTYLPIKLNTHKLFFHYRQNAKDVTNFCLCILSELL